MRVLLRTSVHSVTSELCALEIAETSWLFALASFAGFLDAMARRHVAIYAVRPPYPVRATPPYSDLSSTPLL